MPPVRMYRLKRKKFGRRRRNAIPRGLHAPRSQLKTYNYNFNLATQVIRNDTAAVGGVTVATTSAVVPITSVSVFAGTFGVLGYSDFGLACTNQITDISNFASFTGLYDAYKINSVTVNVEYLSNVNATSGAVNPTVWMYWDQDDAVIPTSVANILGKTGAKRWNVNNKMKSSFTFRYIPVLRNNAQLQSAVVPTKSQWVNCTSTLLPHYALKMWVQDFYSPGTGQDLNAFRINFKYNVSFRSPLIAT